MVGFSFYIYKNNQQTVGASMADYNPIVNFLWLESQVVLDV